LQREKYRIETATFLGKTINTEESSQRTAQ